MATKATSSAQTQAQIPTKYRRDSSTDTSAPSGPEIVARVSAVFLMA